MPASEVVEPIIEDIIMGTVWTTAVEAVTEGMTGIVTTITSNAVMMLAVAVPFVGACIGLAKRLLRFGGRR